MFVLSNESIVVVIVCGGTGQLSVFSSRDTFVDHVAVARRRQLTPLLSVIWNETRFQEVLRTLQYIKLVATLAGEEWERCKKEW